MRLRNNRAYHFLDIKIDEGLYNLLMVVIGEDKLKVQYGLTKYEHEVI